MGWWLDLKFQMVNGELSFRELLKLVNSKEEFDETVVAVSGNSSASGANEKDNGLLCFGSIWSIDR